MIVETVNLDTFTGLFLAVIFAHTASLTAARGSPAGETKCLPLPRKSSATMSIKFWIEGLMEEEKTTWPHDKHKTRSAQE